MVKAVFFLLALLSLSGCINKHGVSVKYYSDCKEYYDMQGYYHKECGDDDIFTYDGAAKGLEESLDEDKPKGNVW